MDQAAQGSRKRSVVGVMAGDEVDETVGSELVPSN